MQWCNLCVGFSTVNDIDDSCGCVSGLGCRDLWDCSASCCAALLDGKSSSGSYMMWPMVLVGHLVWIWVVHWSWITLVGLDWYVVALPRVGMEWLSISKGCNGAMLHQWPCMLVRLLLTGIVSVPGLLGCLWRTASGVIPRGLLGYFSVLWVGGWDHLAALLDFRSQISL